MDVDLADVTRRFWATDDAPPVAALPRDVHDLVADVVAASDARLNYTRAVRRWLDDGFRRANATE